jgi:hypothetical protein
MAANLENFIESLICESLSYMQERELVAKRYPERYRNWLFREVLHMRKFGVDDSQEFIDLTLKLYSDVRPFEKKELKLEELKKSFANPTAINVNWIISLLDVNNYLDELLITVDKVQLNAKAVMSELAERRNEVAHGNVDQQPTIEDVERIRKFCRLFSNQLSKDVIKWTESFCNKKK